MDELITRIEKYLAIINPNIGSIDSELEDFCIREVIDRVLLYLNSDTIPERAERVLANIVNTGLNKVQNQQKLAENGEADRAINSISDNGQSISYANEVTKYFTTASDEEIFSGFSSLLNRYRRIKVVYPKFDEKQDS